MLTLFLAGGGHSDRLGLWSVHMQHHLRQQVSLVSLLSLSLPSRWSREIYLTELLEGNRKEVEKWVKDQEGAYNWQHYMDFQVPPPLLSW